MTKLAIELFSLFLFFFIGESHLMKKKKKKKVLKSFQPPLMFHEMISYNLSRNDHLPLSAFNTHLINILYILKKKNYTNILRKTQTTTMCECKLINY
jgi:hypothetical protein